jgi:hypothetical protein
MEPDRYLFATAQISLALAGFAGVVASFRNQPERVWGDVERFWLRLLLLNAILPFSFSLIGIFIVAVDSMRPIEWRLSSGIALLCLLPYAVWIIRNLRSFAPGSLQAAGGNVFVSRLWFILLLAVCLLQLWNATVKAEFWPFFAAVMALILGAAFQFARLVLTSHRTEIDETSTEISEDG